MIKQKSLVLCAALLCLFVCFAPANPACAQEKQMTASELIAKHLASIGKPESLARIKSRGVTGKAMVNFVQGYSGNLSDGTFLCASEGQNLGMTIKFNDVTYPGEYLAYNGKEVTVKDVSPGKKSPLADFLFTFTNVMKEGYFGGVLSVGWPLLNHKEGQIEYQAKQEKIGAREFQVLERSIGDLKIKLFFDAKTFRHMRTEFVVRQKNVLSAKSGVVTTTDPVGESGSMSGAPAGGRPADYRPRDTIQEASPDSIYKLIEKFDLHAIVGGKENGLMLPQSYGMEFSLEGHGQAFIGQWSVLIDHWMNNGNVDKNFFIAQK